MKVQYMKGVATHHGPESCVPVREDRQLEQYELGGEALTGEHAGQVLSPDIRITGLPTPCAYAEGNIGGRVIASVIRSPRGLRPCACVEASCARTGRSHGHSLVIPASRVGKAKAAIP